MPSSDGKPFKINSLKGFISYGFSQWLGRPVAVFQLKGSFNG
ncbi:hypothetical protein CSB93_5731 [Pseudomonas paraeruginosa]|uniref:Uncharacterized protein n=1 Tax=Pseudomonas paraeruginosa TaxID=2994495 RepID=A0A2R3IX38_9PSED|nr:hypothetical protein CSB93_5731 [Pseudomonas paraeruginosa]